MADGQAPGRNGLFRRQAVVTGVETGEQIDRIDEPHRVQAAEIEDQGVRSSDYAPDHPGSEPEGDQRRPGRRGDADHILHLGDARRPDHAQGRGGRAAEHVAQGADHPVVVPTVRDGGGLGQDLAGPKPVSNRIKNGGHQGSG